jgi:hypothetical protein
VIPEEAGTFADVERHSMRFGLLAVLLLGINVAQADVQPSEAMMAPVRRLVAFMSTLRPAEHPDVFAEHGLCIVENFAPFVFCGKRAAARWENGFREHARDLRELAATFDGAHDFTEAGKRAYFSLPTTWTGLTEGRHFEEHGAWAFVLERSGADSHPGGWRIIGYGWGVTAYSEAQ